MNEFFSKIQIVLDLPGFTDTEAHTYEHLEDYEEEWHHLTKMRMPLKSTSLLTQSA